MNKAILVIDDIPESMFTKKLSIKYQLIYYPDGHLKELGISGKQLLKPLPSKIIRAFDINESFVDGYNYCLDEISGEEE